METKLGHGPSVTAVMVTGKTPERYPLARRSVAAFRKQTYRDARLLIVNDSEVSVLPEGFKDNRVHEVMICPADRTLGALRNVGLDTAGPISDYLMQWDDDDVSHPSRIEWQVASTTQGKASIFRWEIHCNMTSGVAFANDGRGLSMKGWPGTIMHPVKVPYRYLSEGRHEDSHFIYEFIKAEQVEVLDNPVHLYTRCYHGHNTWNESHVMARRPGWRELTPHERKWVDQVLAMPLE